MLNVPVY